MPALVPTAARLAVAGCSLFALCACGHTPSAPEPAEPPPPRAAPSEAVLSPAQEGAYQACLEDRMAVATAWEVIEENCRAQARDSQPKLETPPK